MKTAVVFLSAVVALAGAGSGQASEIIDRSARNVRLAVDANGQALVTYTARGSDHHVRVWGAINARFPNPHIAQVQFRKDYSGRNWSGFRDQCRGYDGPKLAFYVTGCAAPDGSYWTVQSWRRTLPNFGAWPARRTRDVGASSLTLVRRAGDAGGVDRLDL